MMNQELQMSHKRVELLERTP
jgi:hypothetical protein